MGVEISGAPGAAESRGQEIVDAVIHVFEQDGYDAVSPRRIAAEVHVSLKTMYQLFPSLDALRLAAVQHWMEKNVYLLLPEPPADESVTNRLITVFRHLFDPWLRTPAMLAAFSRARLGPGGGVLELQGNDATQTLLPRCFEPGTPAPEVHDVLTVIGHVTHSLMVGYAQGRDKVDDILPTIEMTIRRLCD